MAGATVTLLYDGGSANAYVVGGIATFTTNAAGQYAFFLTSGAPAGNYGLSVSRAGYTFVSTAIPAAAGSWHLPQSAASSPAGTTLFQARWIGPCSSGMVPGDMVLSNGITVNDLKDKKARDSESE